MHADAGAGDVTDAADWRAIFGHEEPYAPQVDGIETAIATARASGFTVIEGACGTGKTMLALTAGLELVRDPDSDFKRVVVLTSVKQQLRQFEADLRTINENLPETHSRVSGLTLVGKADVCPYNRENAGGIDDANVYDRCEHLRETTRTLTGDGGSTTAEALAGQARSQQVGLAESGPGGEADFLETAGEPSPYPREMPTDGDAEYCPFYAQYLADLPEDGDPVEAVPFDFDDRGLIDVEDLIAASASWGTCPHSMLGAVLPHVEVVIGNYYHAFDPTTVGSFTGALLAESTFVICDEAHMLEPRVRDLLGDGIADASLRDADAELARVIQPLEFAARDGTVTTGADGATGSGGVGTRDDEGRLDAAGTATDESAVELIRAELAESEVDLEDLRDLRAFVRDLRAELDRRVTAYLDAEHRGWRAALADLPDAEIPLRDPETPQPDDLTEWAEREGYRGDLWVRAAAVGGVVARILNELDDEERRRAVAGVGRTLGDWYRADHERFFREIELERTWDDTEPGDSWRRAYNARFALHNCVPGAVIGDRLAAFGGGVLMSATLAPLDVFAEVTGLEHLRREEDRPVETRTYGLHFPAENRASFAVDAPKFTYDNRGNPRGPDGDVETNPTRRVYADAIREVAASPGNVLVGMPSYAEAEWAASELRAAPLDKPVLIDESSADDATEQLKREFFAGEPKVLVTSLRGTLTEGVDYRGDRLRAAVVCGVPIVNTASARTRAVRTAYDRVFGDGFEYALTIPAVRKARQAIGRVVRGPEEAGVRVLVDERYARDTWDGVREYFPDDEEFQPVSPDMLSLGLDRFWSSRE